VSIFASNVLLGLLIFLKSSLVFPILLFSSISLHWLLRKAYLSFLFFWTLHLDDYTYIYNLCYYLMFKYLLFIHLDYTHTHIHTHAHTHAHTYIHTHTYTHTHTHTHIATRLPWWQMVMNLPEMWETWVWSLSWKDPLEEGMATHSSILSWRIIMDRGVWWAAVHGVTKSQTWMSD